MTLTPAPQIAPVTSLLREPTADAAAFRDGCDRGELVLPECTGCDRLIYFPRLICPHCGCQALVQRTVDGAGSIHSIAQVGFSPFGKHWAADVPYSVVRVDLDCGPRMLSRLVGPGREGAGIGARVAIRFAPVHGSPHRIPVFELAP